MPDSKKLPLEIKIMYWFGIVFGAMYLIYAVVSIILSFMDRTYQDLNSNLVILIYGAPFMVASYGLKHGLKWGWISFTALMGLVLILSILGKLDFYGILVSVLSVLALILAFLPKVRKQYF